MMKNVLMGFVAALMFFACNEPQKGGGGTTDGGEGGEGGDVQVTEVKNYKKPEAACPKPATMRDLSGGMKQIYYQFTSDNSASLSLFGMANLKLGKKEVVVIVDFLQYKDLTCSGTSVRYGVGARLFLTIKKAQGGIKVTDLPKLAAGVELGKASVTYSIEVIGLTGDKIRAALPSAGDFNVEAYGKVVSAIDKIRALASDGQAGVIIDPQIIPTSN